METITLADYIQYGFMAFMSLLMIAMFVALLRQGRDIGELKGDIRGISKRLDDLTVRVERLEETVMALAGRIGEHTGEIGEMKGMLQDLHRKVDLLMRHRHEPDTGRVFLTPEEVAAD